MKASPALLETLRAHLKAMALEGQVNRWAPEQRQLVFPNKAGRVMQYSTFIEDVWQPLIAKAGLPYRKYHATRHTFATWLLEAGTDLRWVLAPARKAPSPFHERGIRQPGGFISSCPLPCTR